MSEKKTLKKNLKLEDRRKKIPQHVKDAIDERALLLKTIYQNECGGIIEDVNGIKNITSEHTNKLIKKQKVGEALMDVSVLVNIVEAYYDEYTFYQYNIRGQKGSIIALPFFSYDKKHVQKLEGYLIYHDKESYGYSVSELEKLGLETIANYSPSGMAGKLSPLPYNPIGEDDVENALYSLIEKNTKVNLINNLSL